jgi:hypothetical protein
MNKHYKIIWCILINLSFFNSGTIFAGVADTGADVKLTDQIRDIIERNQANFDSVRTLHGTITTIRQTTFSGTGSRVMKQVEEIWYDGAHFRIDTLDEKFIGKETEPLILSEDRGRGHSIYAPRPSGFLQIKSIESSLVYVPENESAIIQPSVDWNENNKKRMNKLLSYQTCSGYTLKEEVKQRAEKGDFYTVKSDNIEGEDCLLLECYNPKTESTTRIWVAPSKGYCIKRLQRLSRGEIKEEYTTTLKEYSPGIWWFDTVSSKTSGGKVGGRPARNVEIKVDKLTINEPIDSKTFTLEGTNIPTGTKVDNRITGERYTHVNKPVPPSLISRPLPDFNDIKIKLSPADVVDKRMLVCFFDMQQRSSRHYIRQLAQKTATLKEKGITIATVQASEVDENTLNDWVEKNDISFPVGMIADDVEKIRFVWGVRSLPWLILTDKKHIVTAEGFALAELDEKLIAK